MPTFSSIDQFLSELRTLQSRLPRIEHQALEEAGEHLVAGAQAMIGREIAQWAALAAVTVQEKARLGYTGRISATDPEYRTGELRISISYSIEGKALILGTTDPIAPFQEMGTSRMPPRPFISTTMFRDGRAAAELVAEHIVAAVGFRKPRSRPRGPL